MKMILSKEKVILAWGEHIQNEQRVAQLGISAWNAVKCWLKKKKKNSLSFQKQHQVVMQRWISIPIIKIINILYQSFAFFLQNNDFS